MCSSDLLCWHSAPAVWAVLDSLGALQLMLSALGVCRVKKAVLVIGLNPGMTVIPFNNIRSAFVAAQVEEGV